MKIPFHVTQKVTGSMVTGSGGVLKLDPAKETWQLPELRNRGHTTEGAIMHASACKPRVGCICKCMQMHVQTLAGVYMQSSQHAQHDEAA